MISDDKNVLNLFLNCHAKSVEEVLSKNVKRDYFETSFSQNLLDQLGMPHELNYELDELKEKIVQLDQEVKDMIPSARVRLTKDPITLGEIDYSHLQSQGITNTTNFQAARRAPHPMLDKISF